MDYMWAGGPLLEQAAEVFPLGSDAVLLADFAAGGQAARAADLGCGCGCIALSLAFQNTGLAVDAVDISPAAVELATRNMARNGLADRVRVLQGDIRAHKALLPAGQYDLVVCNPPYFPVGSGREAAGEGRALARGEGMCTLRNVTEAAAWLLRWGGRLCMVHRPERLAELVCAMSACGMEPKRLRLVQYRVDSAPNLLLLEGRRGGKPGLTVEAPLLLTGPDGGESEEIRRIYRR